METINAVDTETIEGAVTPVDVVINEAVDKGFDLIFRLKEDGSLWDQHGIHYDLHEMKIAYSRVFKNTAGDLTDAPATTIYLLRNSEGDKGILVDADGIYEDRRFDTFINNLNLLQPSKNAPQQTTSYGKRLILAAAGLLLVTSAVTFKLISRRK